MKHTGNIALVLCLVIIGILTYGYFDRSRSKKIGVIQLQEVVYGFEGMKEATKKYTEKMNNWNTQGVSMENKLKELVTEIKQDSINNDKIKLKKDLQVFVLNRQRFFEYKEQTEKAAQEEDKNMTLGVMNQVSEHIKAYALQEGYDVIISNTEAGNVGYVNEATDITKKMIEFANKRYKGEK